MNISRQLDGHMVQESGSLMSQTKLRLHKGGRAVDRAWIEAVKIAIENPAKVAAAFPCCQKVILWVALLLLADQVNEAWSVA